MPAYTQFGNTTEYNFGITTSDAVAGMALETLTISASPEFMAEAKNDEGMTAALVKGDLKGEFSASGFLTGEAAFQGVTNFMFDSNFYIIQNKSISQSNTDFQKCEISGISFTNISS